MNTKEMLMNLLKNNDPELTKDFISQVHAVDIAAELEDLEDFDLQFFLSMLSHEEVAEILESAEEDLQLRISKIYDNSDLIDIFKYMANADVADLLGLLSTYRRKSLLQFMKKSDSNILNMILSFDEDSAGGIMTTEFISLKETLTVKEALLKIKEIAPETEIIESIFITDELHRLLGIVDLRQILVAEDDKILSDILEDFPFFVYAYEDQEKASNIIYKYDLSFLPVLNNNMAILGVITSEDIIDVMEDEHSEDMLAMSGVSPDEAFDSSFWLSVKSRLPWLIINLFTAFMASYVVSTFESTISKVVALAAAMPIVSGMGGNAGSQTLSIVLTSIARDEMNLKEDWRLIFKEIGLGLSNGALLGLLTGIILFLKYNNIFLGIIIFFSMILNMIIAGVAGFLIPLVLDRLKIDPAVASSIFLTTATDIGGFFIFLGLASMLISKLV